MTLKQNCWNVFQYSIDKIFELYATKFILHRQNKCSKWKTHIKINHVFMQNFFEASLNFSKLLSAKIKSFHEIVQPYQGTKRWQWFSKVQQNTNGCRGSFWVWTMRLCYIITSCYNMVQNNTILHTTQRWQEAIYTRIYIWHPISHTHRQALRYVFLANNLQNHPIMGPYCNNHPKNFILTFIEIW